MARTTPSNQTYPAKYTSLVNDMLYSPDKTIDFLAQLEISLDSSYRSRLAAVMRKLTTTLFRKTTKKEHVKF